MGPWPTTLHQIRQSDLTSLPIRLVKKSNLSLFCVLLCDFAELLLFYSLFHLWWQTMTFFCSVCNIEYSSKYSLKRHQNVRHNEMFRGFSCNKCDKKYTAKSSLMKHARKCQATQKPSTQFIQVGRMSRHVDTSESTHQDQEENEKPPSTTNRPLEAILRSNWGAIKTYFKCRKVQDIFNFRLINQKREIGRASCRERV